MLNENIADAQLVHDRLVDNQLVDDQFEQPFEDIALTDADILEAHQYLHTIRDLIRYGVTALRKYDVSLGQGTNDYFAEAAAIVMQTLALDWSVDDQILDAQVLPSEKAEILELLQRRINERVPTAYLLNLVYFAGLPFYVDERVLIPRSPIAELINAGFAPYYAHQDDMNQNSFKGIADNTINKNFDHGLPALNLSQPPQQILDLCTGSGCIAIALANTFDNARVDAIDISKEALAVAALNVDHHNISHSVELLESDLFEKLEAAQQYDLIVSNPPYVDAADMADLPDEFLHEPELALAAGQDGLDIVKKILVQAPDYLSEQGLLVVEVGNSEWQLQQMFPKVPFNWLQFKSGGKGIFSLTKAQLQQYHSDFAAAL